MLNNLTQLAKEAYDNAVNHGLCPVPVETHLHGIIDEISNEAVAACSFERYSVVVVNEIKGYLDKAWDNVRFEHFCKDTLGDELADIFIRTMSLCHEIGIDIDEVVKSNVFPIDLRAATNLEQELLLLTIAVGKSFLVSNDIPVFGRRLVSILKTVVLLADSLNVDIEWHVKAKMKYNKGRPWKHGK